MRQRDTGKIVILTGAGISKESGLDTFRDPDGIWSRVRIEDVATPEAFARNPVRVHDFYNARRQRLRAGDIQPNAAHRALARLQAEWPDEVLVVTQNIDDLHERAGTSSLIHMHGEILTARSRSHEAVTEEVARLVGHGFREIVITGVHLQDYGRDFDPSVPLAELLERIAAVDGLKRIRMSSLGVKSFDDERLFDLLASSPFCPHWHIPLQSGSDQILERMRRDYTVEQFRGVIAELERRVPDASISTDVIVGHPGESEGDFEATLATCRELGFSKIHVFPYSRREETLASKLGGDVDPLEIRRRARVLRELEEELALKYKQRFVGETVEVHVEGDRGEEIPTAAVAAGAEVSPASTAEPPGVTYLEGFTERYMKVRFPSPSYGAESRFPGTFQPVSIHSAEPGRLVGEWAGDCVE